MSDCKSCGAPIKTENQQTDPCPRCGVIRCQTCDAGVGTVCPDCEAEEE